MRLRLKPGAAAAAIAALALLGACGGDADEDAAPTMTTTTTAAARSTTTTTPPSTFRTSTFGAPFTVDLPGGWTALERNADVAQLWVQCDGCDEEGASNGEISLDLTLAAQPPEDVARRLAGANRIQASAIEPFSSGSLRGVHFTAQRPGGFGEIRFEELGYHSEADADPIEVIAVRAGDKTVTIIVDTHKATGDAALDFRSAAAEVLARLRFES